ncbi:MAG: hypothetical protein ACT4QE_16010 [Anaerolineales bacterium]
MSEQDAMSAKREVVLKCILQWLRNGLLPQMSVALSACTVSSTVGYTQSLIESLTRELQPVASGLPFA